MFERLCPFLKHLVELSDSIAQLVWITLVEESLPKSLYLRIIHSADSLSLRRLSFCFLEDVVVQLGKLHRARGRLRSIYDFVVSPRNSPSRSPWQTRMKVVDLLESVLSSPPVSDVQDKKILAELQSFGLKGKYAVHITQAACNDCAVFLTRGRKIIKRRGPGSLR